jgi:hypothetical protein
MIKAISSGVESEMKVIARGLGPTVGLRRVTCENCRAILEIKNTDIQTNFRGIRSDIETFPASRPEIISEVQCPECGHFIEVTE